ncbi:hypothetical protein GXY_15732 [Novacetimonas hansenii ATCC 23769]|uniref:Uncharacterized protein n=1 Tax=Novacetimonas hansenii ATCC 23769 TaxID=714995 RepID=D5QJ13_NOVHA|nr:hypothetical protein GXY_15732 [Novacetimonas hansenii ATCC 23769]
MCRIGRATLDPIGSGDSIAPGFHDVTRRGSG